MAAKSLPQKIIDLVIADWRTGCYTQDELADRHKLSKGKVNAICKPIEQDMIDIVNKGVAYNVALAEEEGKSIKAVQDAVAMRTKHVLFFNESAIINVRGAMKADCNTQYEFKARAETIAKGKETVLGKTPDTAIQVNNTNTHPSLNVILSDND